jgi:squalene-associated FAD-dependent desaturase
VRVAVIGAGWAGCTAALELARRGWRVTVIEAGTVPGGRARRVVRAGLPLDNGQHLLLGAYASTLAAIARAGASSGPLPLARHRLAIRPLADSGAEFSLRARGPGPVGLAAGLLTANGLTLRDRAGVLAWFTRLALSRFRCPVRATAADLAASCPPEAARLLLEPLCLAALNTPPSRASARVFANVLRAAFAGPPRASDFLVPETDLSSLYPEAALQAVARDGGEIVLRTRGRLASCEDDGVWVDVAGARRPFDAALIAVGPHQIDGALPDVPPFADAWRAARGLDFEPIATAWLGYAGRCPLSAPFVRLDDAPGQWLFDRGDILARAAPRPDRPRLATLVSVVVSASGPHDALDAQALARACDAQLRRLVPDWPPLAWSQGIVERRATYACTPTRPRPGTLLPHPRVALAGDWLDAEFPATLEAAVRTGLAAAASLDASKAVRGG